MRNKSEDLISHTGICDENVTNIFYPTRKTAFADFSCGSSNVNVLGMEVSMGIVEKYELFSKIGYISAIIFLLIAIILFFVLKITRVFGYLTGITRRKAISKIKKKNENDENDFITDKINGVGNKRRYTAKIGSVDITSKIVTLQLHNTDESETTLLEQNHNISEKFKIIKDITYIHTNINL